MEFTQDDLWNQIATLGWDVRNDNIVIEIGGTQVSGIYQGEEYNKKWAAQYGDRKYNKDAFIVIKNLSRNDDTKSQPMDREHKPHHLREPEPVEPQDITVNMDGGVGGSWEVKEETKDV
ncbi:hypothetical protein S-MbCM7_151 [Synechococcus phage ACG-2014h]|uniref:Uncharacterized protein n=1 Tax=Synechococcus phage ACG-2014h TaxID=1340810 RepID=V5UT92_9CAUD|nr:hypothetical protein S-MbCM7_151 [Synechococcus phage ACG-2014h]AHB80565.1 hypothetical protein S-MbCM7_151 [Synechococcus phage ACG-2014h]